MSTPQLELSLSVPVNLVARLRALGIAPYRSITLHRNRRVMISVDRHGGVRVHAGYAWAPDEVIAALAAWARPRVRSADRRDAARRFLSFPVHRYVAPSHRRERRGGLLPGDDARLARLAEAHRLFNHQWFQGRLKPIAIRLSDKMRRKLGHYEPSSHGTPVITISRFHLKQDGWPEVLDTLLHEMVHQWQDETGLPVNHGQEFRAKARAVGIEPAAVRRGPLTGRAAAAGGKAPAFVYRRG